MQNFQKSEFGKILLLNAIICWGGLPEQLRILEERIARTNQWITFFLKSSALCKKIEAIDGVGPITATAIVAVVGDAKEFRNSRHLSAWLGLVPRHYSSGGKSRPQGISKRGDSYLRTLLILKAPRGYALHDQQSRCAQPMPSRPERTTRIQSHGGGAVGRAWLD